MGWDVLALSCPEEEQAALPHRHHHQLPGPLRFTGGPPRGLCPLHAPSEHPVPEKHHPLEPDHSLHPTQCHVVCGAAHHEPRGAREQRGIPFPIIIAWAIGKLYYDDEKCWFGKRAGVYTDYIYQGPMILVLLINFIFLFNIVRILMTKLRASTTSETIQYRKAVKATLVLLPLLGITYMLFFVNPGEDEISRIVFIYFNSFLESFQGFFVSVFYCFLNSETGMAAVHPLLWRGKIHPGEDMLSRCACVIWCSRDQRPPHPREILPQGAIGRTEALAPLAGQALHPCPRGEGHVHPHLPDPRQLPQHQAIHGCLSRERAAAPGADVPAVGDPWEGGTAQSQVLPVAPAPQGEHELSRSWDTCTAPAARAGQAWRTGQLRRCFVTSLAAV
ncbi:uncharacterized protein [Aphelocoma coerulescens]|uniref:uncharacterized protein isoform X6 n=1 Tax=Aphelocoma coerulescens TaxID=39617 RepID=UPI00360520BE